MLCAVCAVPTRSGAGEVGTNYRGPAVRKWARGLAVLYIFSVFLFSIIICRFANCSFQTKLKFLCNLFHTNTKLVSRFLVGPSLVERPKKFFPGARTRCQRPCAYALFLLCCTGTLGTVYALICHVGTAENKGKFNECPVSLFLETSITVLLCSDFTMSKDVNEM